MLKLTLSEGKPVTFELVNRDALKLFDKDIGIFFQAYQKQKSQNPSEGATTSEKSNKNKTSGDKSKNEDASSLLSDTIFKPVLFKGKSGSLSLKKDGVCFEPSKGSEITTIPWSNIQKRSASPPKHAKAMLKLVLYEGEAVTFQTKTQAVLEQLQKGVSERLKGQNQTKTVSSTEKSGNIKVTTETGNHGNDSKQHNMEAKSASKRSASVYKPVLLKGKAGSLTFSDKYLCFEPSKGSAIMTILWSSIQKQTVSPPKHSKAMLKLVLSEGEPITFQTKTTPVEPNDGATSDTTKVAGPGSAVHDLKEVKSEVSSNDAGIDIPVEPNVGATSVRAKGAEPASNVQELIEDETRVSINYAGAITPVEPNDVAAAVLEYSVLTS
jgi:hypothetical protein